jgi:hypothetical protein
METMSITCTIFQRLKLSISLPLLLLCALVSGCDEAHQLDGHNSAHEQSTGALDLSLPEQLQSMRAVNLDAIFATVIINGVEQPRWQQSSPYTNTFTITKGEPLSIQISWFETLVDGSELLLATAIINQVITANTNLEIQQSDYVTSGSNFDEDGDLFSNLTERNEGSDPNDASSTPFNLPDVRIQQIDRLDAPRIDGLYDPSWNQATFRDIDNDLLHINNLMIDQGALREDGHMTNEMRWFAMHDDAFLYIFVLGENVADKPIPLRDSFEVWQDDTLNIFIDGDNSKDQTYDGIDDRQILIPLLTDPSNLTNNSTFYVTGFNSAAIPEFEFATCRCTSEQHTWEVQLRLSDFGIVKNQSFGIEIQLEVDHDGGNRDAKWGWFHNSRVDEDVDNTWRNPSFMGTATVE